MKQLEFNIVIKETPKPYIDCLILGLVYSGYDVYFNYEREHICFTGHADEVITQKVTVEE